MRDANGKVDKGHPVRVRAKTGTLNFVSALAGFLTAPDGTELAFAIFTSDLPRRQRARKAKEETPRGARGWKGQVAAAAAAIDRALGDSCTAPDHAKPDLSGLAILSNGHVSRAGTALDGGRVKTVDFQFVARLFKKPEFRLT